MKDGGNPVGMVKFTLTFTTRTTPNLAFSCVLYRIKLASFPAW